MAGLEPAVSRARGVRFSRAKLHPGIGAHDEDRTRLPGSTVRSLRQMGTWAIGALGRDRTGMVSHRPLKTARLPVSPRARIELEDLVGLEPTMLSQRIKNPLPWPLGARGVKSANRPGQTRPTYIRCLKPPSAAPLKETGTGQRIALCPCRGDRPGCEINSNHRSGCDPQPMIG